MMKRCNLTLHKEDVAFIRTHGFNLSLLTRNMISELRKVMKEDFVVKRYSQFKKHMEK